jgi:hypothetical protein
MFKPQRIEVNETKQDCYDVQVSFKGIRNRARKLETHRIKLDESVRFQDIQTSDGELSKEALRHYELEALTAIRKGYRERTGGMRITFHLVKRATEPTLGTVTEFEPFGDGHYVAQVDAEQNITSIEKAGF